MSFINTFTTWEQYIVYLRKSRQDDPTQTVEEVLAKHETMLQEYALREFGHKIPEANIYREVISGESIADREEIKEVLARIKDPNIKGVLVVEPSRLSRGDLTDCGHLIDAFRYTGTQVVTPHMTYNLENKMERKFFQDELLRGNDYLEYTKEILWRGRVAAAKRGCFSVGGPAPFGYKKVKDDKDWILEIVPEDAEIVRMIFDWYVRDGMSCGAIARKLNEMGIKPMKSEHWRDTAVLRILKNEHYKGNIVFNRMKQTTFIDDRGEKIKRRILQKPEDIIIAKGKHKAIIDDETFEAALSRATPKPKNQAKLALKNPLSGLLICGKCGKVMARNITEVDTPRYVCRANTPRCYKAARVNLVEEAFLDALEQIELPALKLKIQNDEGNAVKIQQRVIAKLQEQLSEFEAQEENLMDLLETRVYTPEVFERRYSVLEGKMKVCREELAKAKKALPKSVDYKERAETLEKAIELYKDPSVGAKEKNAFLRTIIDRIEYYGTDLGDGTYRHNPFKIKVFLRL